MLFRRKSAKVAAATVERAAPSREPQAQAVTPSLDADGELDIRSLGRALWRRKWAIIIPTLIVAALTAVAVEVVTPKYKSSATILFEGRENIFLRPDAEKMTVDRGLADMEALTSQVIVGPGQCLLVFVDYLDGGAVLQQPAGDRPLRFAAQERAGNMSGAGRGSEDAGWIPAPGVP